MGEIKSARYSTIKILQANNASGVQPHCYDITRNVDCFVYGVYNKTIMAIYVGETTLHREIISKCVLTHEGHNCI